MKIALEKPDGDQKEPKCSFRVERVREIRELRKEKAQEKMPLTNNEIVAANHAYESTNGDRYLAMIESCSSIVNTPTN